MILDRLEVFDMIKFIEPVIPSDTGSGKNCLFIRVEDGKLICTGGNEYTNKKVVLVNTGAIEQSGKAKKKDGLPDTFMIPRPELLAFKAIMDEHKAYCKKMAKNDPSYLHVEITDSELISHDGCIPYSQPSHEFKDLESLFQIKMGNIKNLKVMSADLAAALKGFKKSKDIEITFSGDQKPVHFLQGDYEAIMLPPVEKETDDNEQTEIDEST
jgi:hypothetical protein